MNLSTYNIDPNRGFVPAEDPLIRLPEPFAEWDRLSAELPYLLLTGQVRSRLKDLQAPDLNLLQSPAELERAMLIISALGMAYVWGGPTPITRLPAPIAVPWFAISEKVGRPPIIAHASAVLNNWRRVDPNGPISADNLACTQHFLGGMDEQWFFTSTTALEVIGAAALKPLVEVKKAIEAKSHSFIVEQLTFIAGVFEKVIAALERVYERCDPHIFYVRVRPFLAGWDKDGLIFEGVSDEPFKLHGGSAAQSSLIQAFDAGLGIEHLHPETRPFLNLMRRYMPPAHRRFVEDLAKGPSLFAYAKQHQNDQPAVRDRFNHCIDLLDQFRQKHMEIAVRYILHQSKEGEKGGLGTGGTSFVPFLSEARKETRTKKI
ncbi:MAG: DUF1864 family protein [Ardenticatenaceae bacterium]|nr:DUF1864 family protein [Ardenticatenaceae bacterium]